MSATAIKLGERRYLVGADWIELPRESSGGSVASRIRTAVERIGLPYGVLRDDSESSESVVVGLASARRTRLPLAADHLSRARGGPLLYIHEFDSDPKQYWVCAVRDGIPEPGADQLVSGDELDSVLQEIIEPWSERGFDLDAVEVFTNSDQIGQTKDFSVIDFDALVSDIKYGDVPTPRRLVHNYRQFARVAFFAAAAAAAAYMYLDTGKPPPPPPEPAEEPVVEAEPEPEEPEEPVDPYIIQRERIADDIKAILDRYRAADRVAAVFDVARAAPRFLAGWKLEIVEVVGDPEVVLIYKRDGLASIERLHRAFGKTGAVSFDSRAERAVVHYPLDLALESRDVLKLLSQSAGQWSGFMDRLLAIEQTNVRLENVRKTQELAQGAGPSEDTGPKIVLNDLAEAEKAAGRPIVNQYRVELGFQGRIRLNRLRQILREAGAVALERFAIDYTQQPIEFEFKGVLYEQA